MWVALSTCSRIISNRWYVPCSLYQMCLVCDNVHRFYVKSGVGHSVIMRWFILFLHLVSIDVGL